jgi:hypothetical protein
MECLRKEAMKYFQAIALFTSEDAEVFRYFHDHPQEIDAVTGDALVVVIPDTALDSDAQDIYSAVGSERYRMLKRSDLPCLYIEDSDDHRFTVRLPPRKEDIVWVVRRISDHADRVGSASELERLINEDRELQRRLRYDMRETQNDGALTPQLLLAVALGVFFLLLIIALVVWIENPTTQQMWVFRVTMSLAAAAIGAIIPGFLHIEGQLANFAVRTGGAVALFVIVYTINPPELVSS